MLTSGKKLLLRLILHFMGNSLETMKGFCQTLFTRHLEKLSGIAELNRDAWKYVQYL